jgi:8-oxo-dGTP pyrophosphatase MutT (NUDIX family)
MRREFSAGGLLARRRRGVSVAALIQPAGATSERWVLPKGHIGPRETSECAALREIAEETGCRGELIERIDTLRYWYSRDGERIFKVVTFFLVVYRTGRIGRLPSATRHQIAAARWVPLEQAVLKLAYPGEREIAARALAMLEADERV